MRLHAQVPNFLRRPPREARTDGPAPEAEIERPSPLVQERERRRSLEQGFYRIAALLSQPLSAEETLNALAHAASDALGGDFAAALMPDGEGLELAGSHLLPNAVASALADGIPPSANVLAGCAEHGQVLASRGAANDDRFGREWRRLAKSSFDSMLAIPIETEQSGEKGLALVFFSQPRLFTDDDLELARNLAHAAKGALERSSMFERERSSRALSQELARIGGVLATELDPERILSEVVRLASGLLGADACTIHVLEGDELVVRAAAGARTGDALGARSPSTAGLAGEVLQSRAPVAIETVPESDPRRSSDEVLSAGYEAYVGAPLAAAKEGLGGVLSVYSDQARQWREEEVEALSSLAANASVALSNAELYQQVAVEKERSETILASVADGIVAVDRDDRVVLWNQAAERITGVPRTEAIGHRSADVLRRTLSSGDDEPAGNRIVPIPRGGEDLWLSVTEAVLRDPAGEITGRIFTFRDISSERLVEQVKSDFVSTVSHQLRAPLTSIYGFAETLLRNDVLFGEDERRTFLRYVVTESERLASIVDTLLNVARLEAGDLEVELVPTDVHAVVDDSVEIVKQTMPENGFELVVDLPPEPLAVEADAEKLCQVLANLLDNAVKFSPGGGKVTVSARPMKERGTVEIEVADEGVGIPHAEQQLIFSKFYRRSELILQEGAGAGLGLFIAQGLVSAMGGDMRVSSVESKGSTFAFELPLAGGPS